MRTNRRQFLERCLATVGTLGAAGCGGERLGATPAARQAAAATPRIIPFVGEGETPCDTLFGDGLDGRLFTDLASLTAEQMITPTERFFVRTRCPDLLPPTADWRVLVAGFSADPAELPIAELRKRARPAGTHVMECSGNSAGGHFGMLGAATWGGLPLTKLLAAVSPAPPRGRILVSGFDQHSRPSRHQSLPGASWIFTAEQLKKSGAFLATEMNGAPLTPDHGAPLRLIVPGWYGCTCIKWVQRIELVPDDAPATAQMREFAIRTEQGRVWELARDYRPAALEQAAMPVRVEALADAGRYRVTGVTWGGACVTRGLMIRFRETGDYQDVSRVWAPEGVTTWAVWQHDWVPDGRGRYAIQLQIRDRSVPQRRLDRGYYTRYLEL